MKRLRPALALLLACAGCLDYNSGNSCRNGADCLPGDLCVHRTCQPAPAEPVTVAFAQPSWHTGVNQPLQLVLNVTGTPDPSVNWSWFSGVVTISPSGLFVSSAPGSYHISALSLADWKTSADATVVVAEPTNWTVSPAGRSLYVGETQQFTATENGSPVTGVVWSEDPSGIFIAASIDAKGVFSAQDPGTYRIRAARPGDRSIGGYVDVQVESIDSLQITPRSLLVVPGGAIGPVTVTLLHTGGTKATGSLAVNVKLLGGPNFTEFPLLGTTTRLTTDGVVTFDDLSIPLSLGRGFLNLSFTVGQTEAEASLDVACPSGTPFGFHVSGAVVNLVGDGLELVLTSPVDHDSTRVTSGSTSFTFSAGADGISVGYGFDVSVGQQPTNPAQQCTVTGAMGVVDCNGPGSITVTCQ